MSSPICIKNLFQSKGLSSVCRCPKCEDKSQKGDQKYEGFFHSDELARVPERERRDDLSSGTMKEKYGL